MRKTIQSSIFLALMALLFSCNQDLVPPVLETTAISKITTTSAVCGGVILDNGGSQITSKGICWSTSDNPTTENNKSIVDNQSDTFISSLDQLSPNTTWHVRSYAINSAGTGYGNELVVKTYSGTVSDSDGNTYYTVNIGSQEWMAENLKTTKYNDGTDIPIVNDGEQWRNLSTPGMCWYQNDQVNFGNSYGALYNWNVVNTGILCPSGWHVPSDSEWTLLENYLVNNSFNYDGTSGFNKLAKALASTSSWTESIFIGSPGNPDYPIKRNASGFSALAAGIRFGSDGIFGLINSYGSWWTSSYGFNSNLSAYSRGIRSTNANIEREVEGNLRKGLSVRCLKD